MSSNAKQSPNSRYQHEILYSVTEYVTDDPSASLRLRIDIKNHQRIGSIAINANMEGEEPKVTYALQDINGKQVALSDSRDAMVRQVIREHLPELKQRQQERKKRLDQLNKTHEIQKQERSPER